MGRSRSDRSRSSSRDALIEAALEEFSVKGYESATVAGIAERAGVTTGALYAHFDGKLDLLIETLGLATVGDFWRALAHASTLPWNEMVEELARGMSLRPDRRTLLLLDIIIVARRDPEVAATLRRALDSHLGAMRRATEKGADVGLIDPAFQPEDIAQLVTALGFGIIVIEALGAPRPSLTSLTSLLDLLLQFHPAEGDDEPGPLARVRTRANASQQATDRLHEAIAAAAADGYSLRKVGEAAGLSHEKVRSIVAAETRATKQT